jgi:hypothetical protein
MRQPRESLPGNPPDGGRRDQRCADGTEGFLEPVFSSEELRRLERSHPEGLPAAAIVELLRQRGFHLAEATFRKYVQLGLLPRSKRVGRKGKHRGSHGLYPAGVVGFITDIRQLMDSGLTLEEIQRSSLSYALEIDTVRRATDGLVGRLEEALESRQLLKGAAATRVKALRMQAEALADALSEATRELLPATPTPVVVTDPTELGREAARALGAVKRTVKASTAGHVSRKRSSSSAAASR